jgi:hypothetical protein
VQALVEEGFVPSRSLNSPNWSISIDAVVREFGERV